MKEWIQTKEEARQKMNAMGKAKQPFLFIVDFECQKPVVIPTHQLRETGIQVQCGTLTAESQKQSISKAFTFLKFPIAKPTYAAKFNQVAKELHKGNSFLLNLTVKTPIQTSWSLPQLYRYSEAKYKLLVPEQFVCFSPEPFVKISAKGEIATYPMKGTIDATLPKAEAQLLANPKEKAEHATIVDLLRNDVSRVARNVRVNRFRFIERVQTHQKPLLQASSEIVGQLPNDYANEIGDLLFQLLPAGSISGAPKPKTLEIIKTVEQEERGYYTGVFGYFDGESVESAVMIRFIQQENEQLFFRSGGGIHAFSDLEAEYNEMIQKIYVPIHRNHSSISKEALVSSLAPATDG